MGFVYEMEDIFCSIFQERYRGEKKYEGEEEGEGEGEEEEEKEEEEEEFYMECLRFRHDCSLSILEKKLWKYISFCVLWIRFDFSFFSSPPPLTSPSRTHSPPFPPSLSPPLSSARFFFNENGAINDNGCETCQENRQEMVKEEGGEGRRREKEEGGEGEGEGGGGICYCPLDSLQFLPSENCCYSPFPLPTSPPSLCSSPFPSPFLSFSSFDKKQKTLKQLQILVKTLSSSLPPLLSHFQNIVTKGRGGGKGRGRDTLSKFLPVFPSVLLSFSLFGVVSDVFLRTFGSQPFVSSPSPSSSSCSSSSEGNLQGKEKEKRKEKERQQKCIGCIEKQYSPDVKIVRKGVVTVNRLSEYLSKNDWKKVVKVMQEWVDVVEMWVEKSEKEEKSEKK